MQWTGRTLGGALIAVICLSGIAPAEPFHADGRFIRDDLGRAVIFHGVNAVWKTGDYYPPDTAEGFQAADAALIKGLGFNVVRLGWIWKGLEPTKGADGSVYLNAIARVEQLFAGQGVYSLIDSHQDMLNERFDGEGAPDWATEDDGIPLLLHAGFPGNYLLPATSRAFDNLWTKFGKEYADAWSQVAGRFKNAPKVLGYDLFNEPWPGTQWPTCAQPAGCPLFDAAFLQPFQEAAAAAIRGAGDDTRMIFYEPHVLFNFGAASWLARAEVSGPVGLSYHDYCLAGDIGAISGNAALGDATKATCPPMDDLVQQNAQSTAVALGGAPLLTEFGAGDDLPELERYIELADKYMVGWIYWQYKNWHDPTGANGPEGLFENDDNLLSLKLAKVALLSRTYPQAVAGTPESYSFDPGTKKFTLTYEADGADPGGSRLTEIFVPVGRHYSPGGYTATVATGSPAIVTSLENASPLTLQNTGSGRVTVTVTAK